MTEATADEIPVQWVESLVGREWEIFWESHDGEEYSDWYESKVLSYDQESGSCRINFVGDETIYEMKLAPKLVRPAVRAWMARTKAILTPSNAFTTIEAWETGLPPDTSLPDDEDKLATLKGDAITVSLDSDNNNDHGVGGTTETPDQNEDSIPLAQPKDRYQIQMLLYSVRVQMHLRSRLEKVEDNDEGGTENGEISEAHIEHLMRCLGAVEYLCLWYEKCWSLQQQILVEPVQNDQNDDKDQTDSNKDSQTKLDGEKEVIQGCLEAGKARILSVLDIDLSWKASSKDKGKTKLSLASSDGGAAAPSSVSSSSSLSLSLPTATSAKTSTATGETTSMATTAAITTTTTSTSTTLMTTIPLNGAGKRQGAALVSSSRRPKRRRTQRDRNEMSSAWGNRAGVTDVNGIMWLEECSVATHRSVNRFVGLVRTNSHSSSFVSGPCVAMILAISTHIQLPLQRWTAKVSTMLLKSYVEYPDENDVHPDSDIDNAGTNGGDGSGADGTQDEAMVIDGDKDTGKTKRGLFSYSDIQAAIDKATTDSLLRRFDLSEWTNLLQTKLVAIEQAEGAIWDQLDHVADAPNTDSLPIVSDSVLTALQNLKSQMKSTDSQLSNVEPLGKANDSPLSISTIDDAITVRFWLIQLALLDKAPQRTVFAESIVEDTTSLPDLPTPETTNADERPESERFWSKVQKRKKDVEQIAADLQHTVTTAAQFSEATNTQEKTDDTVEGKPLQTLEGVEEALKSLRELPFVAIEEEKLEIRREVLQWESSAREIIHRTGSGDDSPVDAVAYDILHCHHQALERIVDNPNRRGQINGLAIRGFKSTGSDRVAAITASLSSFADTEATVLNGYLFQFVKDKHGVATAWKERAEAILQSLRAHGNDMAGKVLHLPKAPPMVDLKRVSDALNDYKTIGVLQPDLYDPLSNVYRAAIAWHTEVDTAITSCVDMQGSIQKITSLRPKGVIMEPARHVVDSVSEVVDWHDRLSKRVSELQRSVAANGEEQKTTVGLADLLLLVCEGIPIIEQFSSAASLENRDQKKRKDSPAFSVNAAHVSSLVKTLGLITGGTNGGKYPRTISLTKIESFVFGRKAIQRLVDPAFDANHGYPLFAGVYLCWRVVVLDLQKKATTAKLPAEERPTLKTAQTTLKAMPMCSNTDDNTEDGVSADENGNNNGKKRLDEALGSIDRDSLDGFKSTIQEAEALETSTMSLLSSQKEMLRGVFRNPDRFRQHASKIKDTQATIKSRHSDGLGFMLNPDLEHQLDAASRDVNWLLRTLPYKALHQDDIAVNDATIKPLPLDVLVSLFERTPAHPDDSSFGDIARVSIRVRELHEAATRWQKEVTACLPLSFRGAKRRTQNGTNGTSAESDGHSKVDMSKLSKLARDGILQKVAMPREAAVQEVLQRANKFEIMLEKLLGEDYEGGASDKAPYPSSTSLVGKQGEFLLYRLTGSPSFTALKRTISALTKIAADVAADTPGKAAFEWIRHAVKWIDGLQTVVTTKSPFDGDKLVIPRPKAIGAYQTGNDLFLDVSDEIRKTLSNHKIFMTTNKQTAKLTVTISKGGAHHSMGAKTIKWCPLLLEWLKKDIAVTQQWETRVADNAKRFSEASQPLMLQPNLDLMSLYSVYRHREEAELLLNEGASKLVVIPHDSTVTATQQLRDVLDRWVNDRTSGNPNNSLTIELVRKQRYVVPDLIAIDRVALLGSLLNRKRLHSVATAAIAPPTPSAKKAPNATKTKNEMEPSTKGQSSPAVPITVDSTSFRDKAKSVLEKGLRKGMRVLALSDASASEMTMLCTMKAWEIENAVFGYYNLGQQKAVVTSSAVMKNYSDKIKAIKANLEDCENPTLSARVLTNKLTAERLATMSEKEMKTMFVRQKKAAAAAAADKSKTTGSGSQSSPRKPSILSTKANPTGTGSTSGKGTDSAVALNPHGPALSPSTSKKRKLMESSPASVLPAPPSLSVPSQLAAVPTSSPKQSKKLSASVSSAPLQAPPMAPALSLSPLTPAARTSELITSTNGGDQFAFTIADPKVTFFTELYLEDSATESSSLVEGRLPESFMLRGRMGVKQYDSFVAAKANGGRWDVTVLRLSVLQRSTDTYRTYYKSYEQRKRIASFDWPEVGGKIFLVTPMFHSASKAVRDRLHSKTHTYAIILTRR